ncbi:MAG: ATP-binding protein, partial [Kiritimatiellaeota bacterium]|nr:ATP-binding protein [Kiritimatiellota bacterium]
MKKVMRDFVLVLEKRLGEKNALIQAVVGPRQVGKTTGVLQCLKKLKTKTLYVSADEHAAPDRAWLMEQWHKARLMPRGSVVAIDEIQKVQGWHEALKELWDNQNPTRLRVVVLGSSSFEINLGLQETLAGRYELIRVSHWGRRESVAIGLAAKRYIAQGGYPGSYRFAKDGGRWQSYLRDAIIENILNKDIFRLRPLSKPVLFRQFMEILRAYPCQEISYTKLLGQLQDKGNVELVKHYLFLLECAFLYRGLEKYSRKEHITKSSSPKILPLCPALCTCSGSLEAWQTPERQGRLFEVMAGMVLATLPGKLYYWRDGNDEVDFVYEDGRTFAIEVKSGKEQTS